jgi:hypothetical protein
LKVDTLNVKYIIDGKISDKPTKMFYNQLNEDELENIHFEVEWTNQKIQSKLSNSTEYAIQYLQKELPDNISIACCQSCQHGNFNPFGDNENEVFCLKDTTLRNREDVVNIFSNQDEPFNTRRRKLLDFCKEYKPISGKEKYTYNDWEFE